MLVISSSHFLDMTANDKWYVIDYSVWGADNILVDSRTHFFIYPDSDFRLELLENLASDKDSFTCDWENGSVLRVSKLESGDFSTIPSVHFITTPDSMFLHLVKMKEAGNGFVRIGDYNTAQSIYKSTQSLIDSYFKRKTPRDVHEVIVPVLLNLALTQLKLCEWSGAAHACTRVLEDHDSANIKALYRRAQARFENRDLGGAKRDLEYVLRLDGKNFDAIQLMKKVQRGDSPDPIVDIHIGYTGGGELGTLRFKLLRNVYPRTVENFLLLADKYKGCAIFKAIKDQFFQTGDYEYNDGSGGNCAIKEDRIVQGRKFFNDEETNDLRETINRGCIGMANYGPNTNGSQFFVSLCTLPKLKVPDCGGVVFGILSSGCDVLDKINLIAGDKYGDMNPKQRIQILTVEIVNR